MPPLFHQYLINDSGERAMHGRAQQHKRGAAEMTVAKYCHVYFFANVIFEVIA